MQISTEFEAILEEKKRQQQEQAPKRNIAIGVGPQLNGKRIVVQAVCRNDELREHLAQAIPEHDVMAEKAKDADQKIKSAAKASVASHAVDSYKNGREV